MTFLRRPSGETTVQLPAEVRSRCTPGNDPVPHCTGAGWASGPLWTGTDPSRLRSQDRWALKGSLHWLCHPGRQHELASKH